MKIEVSTPAESKTDLIHLAIVAVETGLCGLINDKNNFDSNVPFLDLSISVREMYSFNAATGQTEALSEDSKETLRDFPGLEVFTCWVTTKLTEL